MSGVLGILGAIVFLALVLRVATAALVLTGLSSDVAKFQVRSAFFGAGFTTRESEQVLNHPVRRRIVQWLIVGGAVGISGVVASSIVSLAREGHPLLPLVTLLAGMGIVTAITSLTALDQALVRASAAVLRRTTSLETAGYDVLLRLSGDHAVSLVTARAGGALVGRPLSELPPEVTVLGVQRAAGEYVDAPPASLVVEAGDALAVYGPDDLAARLHG